MRVRLTVAFDGTDFHGFAANEGVRTVAGELTSAIGRVVGADVDLTCAGRTDKGVHGWGQVVSFDAPDGSDVRALAMAVSSMLGPEVAIRQAAAVEDGFDARFSATSRTYRYTMLNRQVADPFLARTAWHVPGDLDLRAMRLGCDPLYGEHDFSSFCRKQKPGPDGETPSLVRHVSDAHWDDLGDGLLRFEITASSFCQQMVRSVVGTLVDVGRYRIKAGEIADIIRARDRHAAGQMAPAHGLCLWSVGYD